MVINERVTVGMVNNTPKYVIWRGRNYTIQEIGLHHRFRKGKDLYHIFSVVASSIFMRLRFDSENLSWVLEEIESQMA
jgi:hypothetical protein